MYARGLWIETILLADYGTLWRRIFAYLSIYLMMVCMTRAGFGLRSDIRFGRDAGKEGFRLGGGWVTYDLREIDITKSPFALHQSKIEVAKSLISYLKIR